VPQVNNNEWVQAVIEKERHRLHAKSQIRRMRVCREIIQLKSCKDCSGNPGKPLPCSFSLDGLCSSWIHHRTATEWPWPLFRGL